MLKSKLKSKSQDINRSFKFNPKTLSHWLAKSKIKAINIRTCRHKEKITNQTNTSDSKYWTYKYVTKLWGFKQWNTQIVADSNDLRDIQLLRYLLMGINHEPNIIDD